MVKNMKYKYKITLFTPTYNRGYIISRLYESIKRQTFRDFEWIIFDDGSTDDTENLVNIWKSDDLPAGGHRYFPAGQERPSLRCDGGGHQGL